MMKIVSGVIELLCTDLLLDDEYLECKENRT